MQRHECPSLRVLVQSRVNEDKETDAADGDDDDTSTVDPEGLSRGQMSDCLSGLTRNTLAACCMMCVGVYIARN